MVIKSLNGPDATSFQPGFSPSSKNLINTASDFNAVDKVSRRIITLSPVATDYGQRVARIDGIPLSIAPPHFRWKPVGAWMMEEDISDSDIEVHLMVTSMSPGTNGNEAWEFRFHIDSWDAQTNYDDTGPVIRNNLKLHEDSFDRFILNYTPNILEGKPSARTVSELAILSFREDELPDFSTVTTYPCLFSIQARGANDTTSYSTVEQILFVHACLIVGSRTS